MLYNVVLVSAVQQCESYVYIYACIYIYIYIYINTNTHTSPPSLASFPPTPVPPIWVPTGHRAELPVLYSRFPLAICFPHANVYIPRYSLSLSHPPPPFLCPHFYFLPCKHIHLYHSSRVHLCALIRIYFSLSDLLHSV